MSSRTTLTQRSCQRDEYHALSRIFAGHWNAVLDALYFSGLADSGRHQPVFASGLASKRRRPLDCRSSTIPLKLVYLYDLPRDDRAT
ncbi:hypothetical protein VTO73DRAFT_8998 [Trametes versicolor]